MRKRNHNTSRCLLYRASLQDRRRVRNASLPFGEKRYRSNYQTNLHFLEEYNEENHCALGSQLLAGMAHLFSAWEEKHVFCFENSYQDFHDNVIGLDYDEILEMYIENVAHPSIKPYWQSDSNYLFFRNSILPQIQKIKSQQKT